MKKEFGIQFQGTKGLLVHPFDTEAEAVKWLPMYVHDFGTKGEVVIVVRQWRRISDVDAEDS